MRKLVTKPTVKLEESLKFLHISKRIVQSKESSQPLLKGQRFK